MHEGPNPNARGAPDGAEAPGAVAHVADAPILVVDDDVASIHALCDVLADAGYAVIGTADGAEAMRHLREDRVRLVLLDLRMPRMDGWSFAQLKNADPEIGSIPVVLLSGAGDLATHARELDAAAWLAKPFLPGRLLSVVRGVLGET